MRTQMLISASLLPAALWAADRPNILYIMSDDHAKQTVGVYASTLREFVATPNIDRIGNEGVVMDRCFVTNSISAPSRGAILTGQYSHHNGVYTLADSLPAGSANMAKEMQKAGYNTAIIGKWHLETEPEGFDHYNVLIGQGMYTDPVFIKKGDKPFGRQSHVKYKGYNTDIVTDLSIEFIGQNQEKDKQPFFLMCHYKAPHTPFDAAPRHKNLFEGVVFPEPENMYDQYAGRSVMRNATNKIENNREVDKSLPKEEQRRISYQNFMRKYLRCIASVDDNVGRLLDYLESIGELDNTIIVYTSDQGFFTGEHGLVDKRFFNEESIGMPLLIRYPKEIKPASVNQSMVLNVDFAPTILDFAGIATPSYMDGRSFRGALTESTGYSARKEIYYRYWMNFKGYNIPAHYGIRTDRYKLVYYYGKSLGTNGSIDKENFKPSWELYDLQEDPSEMRNLYGQQRYDGVTSDLKQRLTKLQNKLGDKAK